MNIYYKAQYKRPLYKAGGQRRHKILKKAVFYFAVIAVAALLIIRADSVIYYAKDSMRICYELIIPTLFPFFVCSGLLIYSGFGSLLAKLSQNIMRPLFNVAPAGAAAFVLGIISGYPLGAVTAVQLYNCGSLSKSEAERLLSFCSNSGPLFIIGSVGVSIYGKLSYGIILYCVHIAASLIVGIMFRRFGAAHHNSPPMKLNTADMPLSEVFSTALSNASKNIITVCCSIIFFSSVSRALLELAQLPPLLDAAASGLCEFSTGTLKTSLLNTDIYKKFILTSFITGFSGISVHLQVMAVTAGSGLSLKPYILGKILHGIIAAAITAALLMFLPVSAPVFSDCRSMLSAGAASAPLMLFAGIAAVVIISVTGGYLSLIFRRKRVCNVDITGQK